jgi:hypothetical protein
MHVSCIAASYSTCTSLQCIPHHVEYSYKISRQGQEGRRTSTRREVKPHRPVVLLLSIGMTLRVVYFSWILTTEIPHLSSVQEIPNSSVQK